MVYISLFEMLGEAHAELGKLWGSRMGSLGGTAAFFGGMLVAMLIDRLIPEAENPHEVQDVDDEIKGAHPSKKQLLRGGVLFAIAVTIHNFPEGMAAFISAQGSTAAGLSIAAAIAIALSTIAPAIAQGITAKAAMESMARQPELAGQIRSTLIIALALMEALTIYGLLIAFMLISKI